MTSELRYMLKTNSDCEACTDQESLRALLTHMRVLADDLDLDFARADLEAETPFHVARGVRPQPVPLTLFEPSRATRPAPDRSTD
jgi:hypothetical protein